MKNAFIGGLILISTITSFAAEKKTERKPNMSADFLGCWDTSTLGVVKGQNLYVIARGKESLWLSPGSSKSIKAVLDMAAFSPVKGWQICLSGDDAEVVNLNEAFICTKDTTVAACDAGATIAHSKMIK